MQKQSTIKAQHHARELRRAMTDSERKLWSGLRAEQLGVKFRRQHPLGKYIADFACLDPKLIVELDGAQHAGNARYDSTRDAFFRLQGYEVIRFGSHEPLRNFDGVRTVILDCLTGLRGRAPTPALPQRGREQDPEYLK